MCGYRSGSADRCNPLASCHWIRARRQRNARSYREIAGHSPVAERLACEPCSVQPLLAGSKRKLEQIVARQFMPLIKARQSALGCQVLLVLRDHGCATTDRGSIVDRLRIHVRAADTEALLHHFAETHAAGVQDRKSLRRFVEVRLHRRIQRPSWSAIRFAHDIERRTLAALIANAQL